MSVFDTWSHSFTMIAAAAASLACTATIIIVVVVVAAAAAALYCRAECRPLVISSFWWLWCVRLFKTFTVRTSVDPKFIPYQNKHDMSYSSDHHIHQCYGWILDSVETKSWCGRRNDVFMIWSWVEVVLNRYLQFAIIPEWIRPSFYFCQRLKWQG